MMERHLTKIGKACTGSRTCPTTSGRFSRRRAGYCYPPWHVTRQPPLHDNNTRNLGRHFSSLAGRQAPQKPSRGAWSSLSPTEQAAWEVLRYTEDSWEGRQSPPPWKDWPELTLDEQAAAVYGLGIHDAQEWRNTATAMAVTTTPHDDNNSATEIPSLSSLLDGSYMSGDDDDSKKKNDESRQNKALAIAQETRALRQQRQASAPGASSWAKMALTTAKGLAPIVGPMLRSAAKATPSKGNVALSVAGTLLEHIPTAVDAASGVLDVTGIDTVTYLDDSVSMLEGSNLYDGQKALRSLEQRLKAHTNDDGDERFLPARILKFGDRPLVLSPSEEDWSVSLVTAAWDGSSGGTYMWKMIEEDVRSKYRPAGGKLRVVVITDGADTLSPGEYRGSQGFNPLMRNLLQGGFDIEWHIIVVGNHGLLSSSELSPGDELMYKSLCHATGGQFISVGALGWNECDDSVSEFLDAIEDSGYHDSEEYRKERQAQYKLEARKGKAENFDWLPALPDKDD